MISYTIATRGAQVTHPTRLTHIFITEELTPTISDDSKKVSGSSRVGATIMRHR